MPFEESPWVRDHAGPIPSDPKGERDAKGQTDSNKHASSDQNLREQRAFF